MHLRRRGRKVKVKFRLTGASAGITDAVAELYVARVIDGVSGPEISAEPAERHDEGNRFEYDQDHDNYVFRWSTKNLDKGDYLIRVDLGDGVQRTVPVELR